MLSGNNMQSAVVTADTSNKQGIDGVVGTCNEGNKGTKEHVIPSHINPLIDKITVVVNGFTAEELDGIVKHVHSCNHDHEFFQPVFGGNYKARTKIRVTATETVLMQVKPHSGSHQIKFDWNPSKIGYDGHERFKLLLDGMLPHGYDHLLASGKVTRMDIAVDIHGVHISDLSFFTAYACQGLKYARNGELQTVYLGGQDSPNKWAIYNKSAQLKLATGQQITRIEKRLKMNISLADLNGYENPLLGLDVVSRKMGNKCPEGISSELWKLFRRTSRYEPCHMIFADLEKSTRQIIRQWLKGKAVKWWQPEKVWKAFPKLLTELGLLTPLHGKVSAGLGDTTDKAA